MLDERGLDIQKTALKSAGGDTLGRVSGQVVLVLEFP